MKKFAKKNNKGFSLVELIVVVLIMAIIAVALAPQVMKWVGNARQSADVNNYESLYANVQLALVDKAAFEEVTKADNDGKTIIITTNGSGTAISGTATYTNFDVAMTALDGGWKKIARKNGSTDYVITITCNKSGTPSVAKTTEPTITSNDLK